VTAARHAKLARELLDSTDSYWLLGLTATAEFCVAYLSGNFDEADVRAQEALTSFGMTGHARTRVISLINLGHLFLKRGETAKAKRLLDQAWAASVAFPRVRDNILEGFAELELANGELKRCNSYLDKLAASGHVETTYPRLCAVQTRCLSLSRQGQWAEVLAQARYGLELELVSGQKVLSSIFLLLRAEASAVLGDFAAAARDILAAAGEREDVSLDLLAEIQRVTARSLAREGDRVGATAAYARAVRILGALGHARRHADVAHEAAQEQVPPESSSAEPTTLTEPGSPDPANAAGAGYRPDLLLRRAVAALEQAARPELLGMELLAILIDSGCARAGAVVQTTAGGPKPYHLTGWTPEQATAAALSPDPPAIQLGTARGIDWILISEVAPTVLARTAWMAVHRLAASGLALAAARLEARERQALWPIDNPDDPAPGVFISEQMVELARIARRVAAAPITVLLTGETGVGKEIFAHMIHDASPRAGKAFVPFNCAAVPRELIESQLFGHRKGAFTGADQSSQGVIRAASGGTLFLDEIGEVPLDLQAKLLRFLELGEVHPLGDPQPTRADVRVVAATNQDLDALVKGGGFREDLYYRLNVVRLTIPPLRERREEIPRFVQLFLERFAREQHKGRLRIADETLEYLVLYNWPGNVRELMNEVRRMAAFAEADAILMPEHLSQKLSASRRTRPPSERDLLPTELVVRIDQPLAAATEHLERAMIQHAMARYQGHVEHVARALGLSRKGLYLKRRRLGFDVGADAPPSARLA
jgi:DNA-binding NtrC family response regulator